MAIAWTVNSPLRTPLLPPQYPTQRVSLLWVLACWTGVAFDLADIACVIIRPEIQRMNYEYLMSVVKVSVTSFQESKAEVGTIFYTVEMEANDRKWTLEKRFSEFDALFNGLKNTFHSLPVLPKKNFLFKLTEKDLEARRKALEEFLQKIVVRMDLINSELVKQFLQLEKFAQDVMVNPPRLEVEYSIEGNTKGIRDFCFLPLANTFLIATADMSPVSRLNAKVSNTKLPWESDGNTKFMEVGSIESWLADPISQKFTKLWGKGYPQETYCLAHDPASKRALVGLEDGVVDFVSVGESEYHEIACVKVHQARVTGLAYDSVSNVVYSVSMDKVLRVSHGTSLAAIASLPHKEALLVLVRDITNKRLFIGTKGGEVLLYDISQAEKPRQLSVVRNNKLGAIRCLFFDVARNYLFSGSFDDGELNVFDLRNPGKEKLAHLTGTLFGKEKIRSIAWTFNRGEIISATADGTITFWSTSEAKPICRRCDSDLLQAFNKEITRIEYLQEKNSLIVASKDRSLKIYELPREWRDTVKVADENKKLHKHAFDEHRKNLGRRLDNAEMDSDEDDLAGWHLD